MVERGGLGRVDIGDVARETILDRSGPIASFINSAIWVFTCGYLYVFLGGKF